ncbi:MAG: hypothetical protein ACXWPM_06975 [Bdellovibrionota bacterium]
MRQSRIRLMGYVLRAALLAIVMIPGARAELVFENNTNAATSDDAAMEAAPAAPAPRGGDRENLRQALGASEKARATVQTQAAPAPLAAAPAQVTQTPVAQAQADASSASDVQNLSKAELMRRERVREELKNEDILQERLEELRLRDERRRTDQLLGVQAATGAEGAAPAQAVAAPAPATAVQTQVISAPVTERPGELQAGPQIASATMATDRIGSSASAPISASSVFMMQDPGDSRQWVTFAPRAGMTGIFAPVGYDVRPKFGAGATAAVNVSDYVGIEAAYTYSEIGYGMGSNNWLVGQNQALATYYGNRVLPDTQTLKHNAFDLGVKVHVLNPTFRIRPFIGGGGGYSLSYINYGSQYVQGLQSVGDTASAQDYKVNAFQGYVSAGLDIQITKNIALGAEFRYYHILTASENAPLNLYGLSNLNPYAAPYTYTGQVATAEKQAVGASLTQGGGMYSLLAGLNFSF